MATMKQFDFRKIREYRLERNISQTELADKIGVKKQQLSVWEKTPGNLTVRNLSKLCEALNKSTDDFFIEVQRPGCAGPRIGAE